MISMKHYRNKHSKEQKCAYSAEPIHDAPKAFMNQHEIENAKSEYPNHRDYRLRHKYSPLGVTLQSCWMMRCGGDAGIDDGGGLVGAFTPVHLTGGGGTIAGPGDCGMGAILGGGGKTYPWARTVVETHNRIDAIAMRMKVLLFGDCRPIQHCTRNWMRVVS